MSKVRILSPRPENSNRRIRGGFNFLFGTFGFERQNSFVGFERFPRTVLCSTGCGAFLTISLCVACEIYSLSLNLSRESDKSACILVLIRTALTLVLIYSDSLGLARNVPNLRGIRDNLPAFGTWQIYSLSPRPENSKPPYRAVFCLVSNNYPEFERYVFRKRHLYTSFELFNVKF